MWKEKKSNQFVPVSLAVVQCAASPEGLIIILSPANEGHSCPEGSKKPNKNNQTDGAAPLQLRPCMARTRFIQHECVLSQCLLCDTSESRLTSTILVISVPGDGCYEVEAGQSRHEALEAMSLAPF